MQIPSFGSVNASPRMGGGGVKGNGVSIPAELMGDLSGRSMSVRFMMNHFMT
jgi:hypothetical protein